MIYYGDEIGLAGGDDPDNRRDFPGGWKEDRHNAFEESGRTPGEQQLFGAVRKLLHVRAESEALRTGKMTDLLITEQVYAFARVSRSDRAIVVFNNGPKEFAGAIKVDPAGIAGGAAMTDRYGSAPAIEVQGGAIDVRVGPRSVAIYR